ncbi:hypothetical protein UCDDS831_g08501 [Diplodia seriata]|uniref:Uncharacterized protein n=1 Tax=Diplodia seriata TaxID=420778 RepID=A0A0G2DV19_9PEZI|nr:hypothetical protein UCDDS831_g08501 [Diplodia seriata]
MNPTQTFAYTTAPDAYVPLDDPSGTPITKPTAGTFVITTNIPGGTNLVAATVTGTLDPSQPLLITATGTDIPGGTLVFTKTGPILAGPTTSSPGSPSSPSSGNAADPSNDNDGAAAIFATSTSFTLPHYILGTYIPTLLAVLYGILWSTILSGIAETAPFFRLARPRGATAREAGSEARFGIGMAWDKAAGGWTYGFTVVDGAEHEKAAAPMLTYGEGDDGVAHEAAGGSVLPLLLRPAMLVVFQLVLLGLLAILLYYWFNGVSSPLEDFLNSQTYGPKLMMSCFGIVIRTWWSEIARAIHTMEPYRRIALGRASAHSSILAPTSPHAIPAIFSSLRRRHFFPAYLSLLAVLSEILIVTLASVPFYIATLLEAFRVSVFVSLTRICLVLGGTRIVGSPLSG